MSESSCDEILGPSVQSAAVREFVSSAASTDESIVLLGEPGSGKELVSRAVHQASERQLQPFLIVDCSLYYERELKRELFGYRGVGPTAKARKGLLEFASKGTCYLSRVEELTTSLQDVLLEFLQTKKFRRLGDGREIASDVRLIVSSDKNLDGFVRGGLFSDELYREMSSLTCKLPALRERSEDVGCVAQHYLDELSKRRNIKSPTLTDDAVEALQCYPWPGNCEELRQEISRAIEKGADPVTPDQLSLEISSFWVGRKGDPELRKVLEELDGYIREFKVLSRLDAEFGDVLLNAQDWDLQFPKQSRQMGESLF